MRVLVADDDPTSRIHLERHLKKWGHAVVSVTDGQAAWEHLEGDEGAPLAILDWVMPGLTGLQICRRARETGLAEDHHFILLTARSGTQSMVEGLEAGADDYLVKPFDPAELKARVEVGARIVRLRRDLSARIRELQDALDRVQQLEGMLPICSYCKSVRSDEEYWETVESYLSQRSEMKFSHGICPDCWEREVEPRLQEAESLSKRDPKSPTSSISKPERD